MDSNCRQRRNECNGICNVTQETNKQTTLTCDQLHIDYRTLPLEICIVNRITKPNDKLWA
jgi:hypothetical protein